MLTNPLTVLVAGQNIEHNLFQFRCGCKQTAAVFCKSSPVRCFQKCHLIGGRGERQAVVLLLNDASNFVKIIQNISRPVLSIHPDVRCINLQKLSAVLLFVERMCVWIHAFGCEQLKGQ